MRYENQEPVAEPGGGVATAAGVLALLGAAANLIGVLRLGLDFLDDPGRFDNSLAAIALLGGLLLAGALTYGAVLIFRRDEIGRFTVIVAAGVWGAFAAVSLLRAGTGYEFDYGAHWFAESGRLTESLFADAGLVGAVTAFLGADTVANGAALVLPVLIALAAGSRYTGRWITSASPTRLADRRFRP